MNYPKIDHVCDIVGDYSEGFLFASYNCEELLGLLLDKRLDERAAWVQQEYASRTKDQLGKFYREDGQYAKQLMHYIVQAGGFPFEWRPDPVTPLTRETVSRWGSELMPNEPNPDWVGKFEALAKEMSFSLP